jgi:S1-C subfamily serine protease
MFIAPQFVLTAKHVVEGGQEVWLGNVKDQHTPVPVKEVYCHDTLDIALVTLGSPNAR